VIGAATQDIPAGAHVHSQNLAVSALRRDAEPGARHGRNEPARNFMGYRRADGRVGVRNHGAC
jgi:hypothetical protein